MLALVASASSSPATGIETCANARRTADVSEPGERTMTAICEYGTPSTRCARRNWYAMYCASSDTDRNLSIETAPFVSVLTHVRSCVGPVNLKLDETLMPSA